jgi:hypothetical protein
MDFDIMQAIQNVGVPTAILFYILTIGKTTMDKMSTAINNQTTAVQELTNYIKQGAKQ